MTMMNEGASELESYYGSQHPLHEAKRLKTSDQVDNANPVDKLYVIQTLWCEIHPYLNFNEVHRLGATCSSLRKLTRNPQGKVVAREVTTEIMGSSYPFALQQNIFHNLCLSKVEEFHADRLFTHHHSAEQQVANFRALVKAIPLMTKVKHLGIDLEGIFHHILGDKDNTSIAISLDQFTKLAVLLMGKTLGSFQVRLGDTHWKLLHMLAVAMQFGTFSDLRIYGAKWNLDTIEGHSASVFADDFVDTTRTIQSLKLELKVYYFQQVILPAIARHRGKDKRQPSCTELKLDLLKLPAALGHLSGDELTTIMDHFGAIDSFQKLELNLAQMHDVSLNQGFAAALQAFLEKRLTTKEVTLKLWNDEDGHFIRVLAGFVLAKKRSSNACSQTKVNYSVADRPPKKSLAAALEKTLSSAGISFKLTVDDSETSSNGWDLTICL